MDYVDVFQAAAVVIVVAVVVALVVEIVVAVATVVAVAVATVVVVAVVTVVAVALDLVAVVLQLALVALAALVADVTEEIGVANYNSKMNIVEWIMKRLLNEEPKYWLFRDSLFHYHLIILRTSAPFRY